MDDFPLYIKIKNKGGSFDLAGIHDFPIDGNIVIPNANISELLNYQNYASNLCGEGTPGRFDLNDIVWIPLYSCETHFPVFSTVEINRLPEYDKPAYFLYFSCHHFILGICEIALSSISASSSF